MRQKERESSSLRKTGSLFVVIMFVVIAHTVWTVDGFSPARLPSSSSSSSSHHQRQKTMALVPTMRISKRASAPQRFSTTRFLQMDQTDDKATNSSSQSNSQKLRKEADQLRAKAQQLRQEVSASSRIHSDTFEPSMTQETSQTPATPTTSRTSSPWNVVLSDKIDDDDDVGLGYRLYIDVGREDGTWMDRRWGASGRRISLTLDVLFTREEVVDNDAAITTTRTDMVLDNIAGSSSPTMVLQTARKARLRDGFDEMKCGSGITSSNGKSAYYRIDYNDNKKQRTASSDTVRFYIPVAGTKSDQNYGDIDIPQGNLYFSVPCFGGSVRQLSTKEGVVTVRQVGWNTGWRREESRIVGIFQAKPIAEARRKDGF